MTARKDKALGATLVGVSVLFLACQSLKLIPDVYEGFFCGEKEEEGSGYCPSNQFMDIIVTVSNLLMCINSAANFIMYMVRGSKFRRAFIRTYTTAWCRAKMARK